LHVVDLDGARAGEPRSLRHLERIAGLGVRVQYGGGLRRLEAISEAIAAGAGRVILGTAAFRDPDLLERAVTLHGDRLAGGVDVRGGRVSVAGWSEQVEMSGEEAIAALEARGVATILYTSVDRDGMLSGPDLEEVRRAAGAVTSRLLYSGGIGSLDDLRALRSLCLPNLEGVISGKALYERRFSLGEALAALG
jgi:phosphoribosylformimino-5-aminoimidazole carboxamide ribotide isomerase